MFVLHPHGKGGAGGAAKGRAQLWNFGQLGIYFAVLRIAYTFFAGREEAPALEK